MIGTSKETARIFSKVLESGVKVFFVEHPEFFCRDELYGTPLGDYADNDKRFIFFQRIVLKTIEQQELDPDILHCHDWQTGLIPVYLKTTEAENPSFKKTKTVFTIHNLAYQGNFPPDSLPATGLSWDLFHCDLLEFYGKVSFIKGGLIFSDALTAVSETYSGEIQTKEFGCGLEGVIKKRKETLSGILNGINPHDWNPETDPDIEVNFSRKDLGYKNDNKCLLQQENGFKADIRTPLFGFVSRLVDQKGLDILLPAMDDLSKLGIQLVMLGTGEERYHQALIDLAKKHKKWLSVHIIFDLQMAKRIYAGSDMFLLPSYYEPCGLGQMIAFRFGTIPVVRKIGGFADTVQEFNPKTGKGNGFLFEEYSAKALVGVLKEAKKAFKREKTWAKLIENAMACDFSWKNSAEKYSRLYESVKHRIVKIAKS